ncbi:MAG: hypothetical protein FWG14_07885 [Peptococcaceae bacterium]|nr:hypothetical protein [Peptococcaceae bacterium]
MWKYEAVNEYNTISLHDCYIMHIDEQDGNIIFSFERGFWIIETNNKNPFHKTLRTEDGAKLTLTNANCVEILFEDKNISWHEFCRRINADEWKFECIHDNYTANQCAYEGWIYFDKEPYHMELGLKFTFGDAIYHWNEICENRPW